MKKNLKKVFVAGLAATMVMGISVPAFAETEDESVKTFTKVYDSIGDDAVSPAETFSFENIAFVSATETGVGYTEAWANTHLPSIDEVTYSKGDAGLDANKTKTFTVTLPEGYPSVGIYTYSFKEVDNNVEGVDYNDTLMLLKVTVVEDNGYRRVAAMHCEGADGTVKTGSFTNTYSAGKLSVQKVVEGNMGDQAKEFEITVTFKAGEDDIVMSDITYTDPDDNKEITIAAGENGWTEKTAKIYLNHNETITFNNIPEGVSYTVVETDLANKANDGATDTYEVTYSNETGTISTDLIEATVTNTKTTEVDTGISLDSMPYLMTLALSAMGALGFVSKKRKEEEMF